MFVGGGKVDARVMVLLVEVFKEMERALPFLVQDQKGKLEITHSDLEGENMEIWSMVRN